MRQCDFGDEDIGEDTAYSVWHGRSHPLTIWADSTAAAAQQYANRKNINNQTKIAVVPLSAITRFEAQVGIFVKPISS